MSLKLDFSSIEVLPIIINIITIAIQNQSMNSMIHLSGSSRHLNWYLRSKGAFIKIPETIRNQPTIFFAHKNITFKHMLVGMLLPDSAVVYPEGVGAETPVLDFLTDSSSAKAVEFNINGSKKFLRNKGCNRDIQLMKEVRKNPTSIYTRLQKYLGPINLDQVNPSTRINYFLNHYYLRLNAQAYCRAKGIPPSQPMTEDLKAEILDYIGHEYENDSPLAIKNLQEEREMLSQKISLLQMEIDELQSQCERRLSLYKWGAIAVTTVHVTSFGYMIFFVDWLGWDIIEPLTYTVGVLYSLLGIRFYRKFKADRTSDNIREVLLKQVISPFKLIQLKDLRNRMLIEEQQLKRIEARSRLLKNRISFRTSLCSSISKSSII